ncbi:uncharacterized protein EV422DRAFT_526600 [Fimicolochytrium jonesii]|uniref:uncharacterized protein n=1 Tax=Fimicolochytrium jonesii TaxID=1396493 RepID=UPI0022FE0FF1|nr:uncharacterized protein EV422DRAFT_526600 [Fimicolochytrium jonesii]KAI8821696.1 hypothetical protein EV422DRAFT_526600 [Fimicolochytrium jonesii]
MTKVHSLLYSLSLSSWRRPLAVPRCGELLPKLRSLCSTTKRTPMENRLCAAHYLRDGEGTTVPSSAKGHPGYYAPKPMEGIPRCPRAHVHPCTWNLLSLSLRHTIPCPYSNAKMGKGGRSTIIFVVISDLPTPVRQCAKAFPATHGIRATRDDLEDPIALLRQAAFPRICGRWCASGKANRTFRIATDNTLITSTRKAFTAEFVTRCTIVRHRQGPLPLSVGRCARRIAKGHYRPYCTKHFPDGSNSRNLESAEPGRCCPESGVSKRCPRIGGKQSARPPSNHYPEQYLGGH